MRRCGFYLANLVLGLAVMSAPNAADVLSIRNIGMELARDIAGAAIMECRKLGYQVSAVVVDRNGIPKAVLRDDLASRFTLQIAEDKANAVVLSGVDSGSFRQNRRDIQQEMNHVRGILMLQGGLPIVSAGSPIGALGISGAPGGENDEICARAALVGLEERLQFAD